MQQKPKTERVNWDTIILRNMVKQLENTLDTLEKSKKYLETGDQEKALALLNITISDIKTYLQFLNKNL